MAPRNKEQLLTAYETQYGSKFDMTPFNALRAVVGDKATEAALLARLRELLPTGNDEEQRDWAAEFLAVDANAALVASLRKIVNQVAESLATVRKDGSQLSIVVDTAAAADQQVVLNNKPRRTRTNIDRVYDGGEEKYSLGSVLKANDVQEMFISFGKGENKARYAFPVKYSKAEKDMSGTQFRHNGKWYSIGALNQVVKELAKAHTDKGAINTWSNVKVTVAGETQTIATLYEDNMPDSDNGE